MSEDWYEAQKRQAAERRAKQEREDLEYQAQRERELAEHADRRARDAKRELERARNEAQNERDEYEEALSELRDQKRALNALLVNLAVKAVPVLRAFLLMAGGMPLGVPVPPAVDLVKEAESLLKDLEPLSDAERERLARKIARAANPEESEASC